MVKGVPGLPAASCGAAGERAGPGDLFRAEFFDAFRFDIDDNASVSARFAVFAFFPVAQGTRRERQPLRRWRRRPTKQQLAYCMRSALWFGGGARVRVDDQHSRTKIDRQAANDRGP